MIPTLRRRARQDLLSPFSALSRDLATVFDPWADDDQERARTGAYPVDVREDDDNIYVEAEMPGFQKEDIDVNLEGGVLSITAERTPEEFTGTRHVNERRFTRVQRSFSLPTTVDESDVDARFEDGVLKLTLSKKQEARGRKIEVK